MLYKDIKSIYLVKDIKVFKGKVLRIVNRLNILYLTVCYYDIKY